MLRMSLVLLLFEYSFAETVLLILSSHAAT